MYELLNWLKATNVITKRDKVITKSGLCYSFETDIRSAFSTFEHSIKTAKMIYNLIEFNGFDYFIGVPETGTVISFYLNLCRYNETLYDFPINYLRASPKIYQKETHSINTILPSVSPNKIVLVEDDVVTGNSLYRSIDRVIDMGLELKGILVLLDREAVVDNRTVRDHITNHYGLSYQSLVNKQNIEDIIITLDKEG